MLIFSFFSSSSSHITFRSFYIFCMNMHVCIINPFIFLVNFFIYIFTHFWKQEYGSMGGGRSVGHVLGMGSHTIVIEMNCTSGDK